MWEKLGFKFYFVFFFYLKFYFVYPVMIVLRKVLCNMSVQYTCLVIYIFPCGAAKQRGHGLHILEVFHNTHNDAPQSVGLLWTSRRRDLRLTTHNTHNRQTSMPPVGFEPTISAGERPQTYALDRAVTGTGMYNLYVLLMYKKVFYVLFYAF